MILSTLVPRIIVVRVASFAEATRTGAKTAVPKAGATYIHLTLLVDRPVVDLLHVQQMGEILDTIEASHTEHCKRARGIIIATSLLIALSTTATKAEEPRMDTQSLSVDAFSLETLPGTRLPGKDRLKNAAEVSTRGVVSDTGPAVQVGASKSEAESVPPAAAQNYRLENQQRGWTKGLGRLEGVYQVLNVIDMAQTLKCLDMRYCIEKNVILGKRPSKLAVIGFTAATGLGHYILIRSAARSNTDGAKAISIASLVVSGAVVGINFKELF